MNTVVVLAAQYTIFVIAAGTLLVWWQLRLHQRRRFAVAMAVAFVTALALIRVAGALVSDTRPFVEEHVRPLFPHAPDNGFPSDHTVLAVMSGALVFLFRRRAGLLLLGLAILLGISRVLARVHHPVDIVGGAAIGLTAAGIGQTAAGLLVDRLPPRLLS